MTADNSTCKHRRKLLFQAFGAGVGGVVLSTGKLDAAVLAATASGDSPTDKSPNNSLPEARAKSDAMTRLIEEASAFERLNSLVVLEDGVKTVAEDFSNNGLHTAVNVKSVSKSIVSAITGVALQRGVIDSVTQRLGDLAPELIPKSADPRVKTLTIQNLLTMQTGLQRTSGRNYGAWVNSNDWVSYVLTRPFVEKPGGQMLYSTGDWHVLGAVLAELTGKNLLSLSRSWLGDPLGIDFAPWTRDPQGRYLGGNEMSLSPDHLALFGQLYLTGGGDILTKDWIEQSLTPRTRSRWSGDAYGYGWFIRDRAEPSYFYARGYGGQYVFLLPSTNRVVVMMSDWSRAARGGVYTEQLHDLVVRYCL